MVNDFQAQFDWQMQFMPQVEQKIRTYAGYFLRFEIASPYQDKFEGTDMILNVEGSGDRWAVRLRTPESVNFPDGGPRYRDLTIRAKGIGMSTELDKLRAESCPIHWYFYGWPGDDNRLREFMIIDIQRAWAGGVFQKHRTYIPNGDGTKFVNIPRGELIECNALVVSNVIDANGYHNHWRAPTYLDLMTEAKNEA